MTTYNTGNPIGSTAVKDLYDNAENLDILTNDRTIRSHPDRLGVPRKTWYGMEQDFQDFLVNSGYQQIGDYAPGLEITARNQVFWKDGELYRAGASLELPYTTTGVWDGEGGEAGLFVAVGDQVLRQQLADDESLAQGAFLVARSSVTLDSIEELRSVTQEQARPDLTYEVKDYYGDGEGGGGSMKFVPGDTTPDDGYMHFGSHSTGRWVRTDAEPFLDARKIGLRRTTPHANQARIQQVLDDFAASNGGGLQLPGWIFEIDTPLYMGNRTTLQGIGNAGTQIIPVGDIAGVVIEHRNGIVANRPVLRDLFIHHRDNDGSYTDGYGVVIRGSTALGKLWKASLYNVQAYRSTYGVYLTNQAVETFLCNVELNGNGLGQTGLYESSNSYDTDAVHLYCEGFRRFGMELFGGSGTFYHYHAVANGSDDGAGNVIGGGLNLRTNYNNFYNPHFDRNIGAGVIVGGFSGENPMIGNKFFGMMSFNNGDGPSQPTVKTPNVRVGRTLDLEFHGGHIGRLGSDRAANNIRGVEFASSDQTTGVKFFGTHFRGHTEYHLYANTPVAAGSVTMSSPSFDETSQIMNFNCAGVRVSNAVGGGSNDVISQSETATLSNDEFNSFGADHWLLHPQGNALDDLTVIGGGAVGRIIYIRRHPSATQTIRVRQDGNIRLKTTESGETFFSLNSTFKILRLVYLDGGNWVEI